MLVAITALGSQQNYWLHIHVHFEGMIPLVITSLEDTSIEHVSNYMLNRLQCRCKSFIKLGRIESIPLLANNE